MKLYNIKKELFLIILILAIFAVGYYFYPQLPERVPTHWGWSSKTFAVFFFPGLLLFIYGLLSALPLLDPLKKNIELFSGLYFWFKAVFILFMGSLYGMTLYAGLGHTVDVGRWVILGIAILFFFLGLMLPKIKKNYTIGIRLPWTLHSEIVWDKTHKAGGKLFIILALLMAIISFFPGALAFYILIGGIILMLLTLMGYSYWQWRLIEQGKKY
jgi:uncharacterized membrane protein